MSEPSFVFFNNVEASKIGELISENVDSGPFGLPWSSYCQAPASLNKTRWDELLMEESGDGLITGLVADLIAGEEVVEDDESIKENNNLTCVKKAVRKALIP